MIRPKFKKGDYIMGAFGGAVGHYQVVGFRYEEKSRAGDHVEEDSFT